MKMASVHAPGTCCIFMLLWLAVPYVVLAAVPEVALESDPLITLRCAAYPPTALTVSGATLSATSIAGNELYLYQAAFNAASWSGSLKKFRVSFSSVDGALKTASVADWDAADILTGTAASPASSARSAPEARRIYTAAGQPAVTIPFVWDALPAAQRTMLNTSPASGIDDQLGEKRVDYLRGGRQYELGKTGGIFRVRDRVLGAIVHNAPVFVGPPSTALQGHDYAVFYAANKARLPAVYVGADDGMLHAFDAGTGEELFAYIPAALFARLGDLTRQGAAHHAYVDGMIAVAEARVGKQWKTILVAGLGSGGQGVFALDVTTPDRFEQGLGALWEFSDADDPDIGYVTGVPVIAKFRVGATKGVPDYRYFAIVASGLNNYHPDGQGKFNVHASNALFLLSLDKAKTDKWIAGVNYFKFLTPASEQNLPNGLIAPAVALAGDGAVAYVYAGDLQGNLWRYDFSGSPPWPNALGKAAVQPLFIAMDKSGNRQAITQQALVTFASDDDHLILFGSGKFIEGSDLDASHFKQQSFYAILDTLDRKPAIRSQLAERKLAAIDSGSSALEISGSDFKYDVAGPGEKGWYFDFIDSDKTGERSVSAAQLIDGNLFFNTLIPNADPCKQHGGRAYVLHALAGLPPYANVTAYLSNTGAMNTPLVVALVPAQTPPRDAAGKRRLKKKLEVLDPLAGDAVVATAPAGKNSTSYLTTAGRLSWREIVNWLELRTSVNKK